MTGLKYLLFVGGTSLIGYPIAALLGLVTYLEGGPGGAVAFGVMVVSVILGVIWATIADR